MTKIADDKSIVLDSADVYVGSTGSGSVDKELGSKLHFRGADKNTDPQWIARYDSDQDNTTLRINVGDNKKAGAHDNVEIGYTYHDGGKWYAVLRVDSKGVVTVFGDLHVEGKLKPKKTLELSGDLTVGGNLTVDKTLTLNDLPKESSEGHDFLQVDEKTNKVSQQKD